MHIHVCQLSLFLLCGPSRRYTSKELNIPPQSAVKIQPEAHPDGVCHFDAVHVHVGPRNEGPSVMMELGSEFCVAWEESG